MTAARSASAATVAGTEQAVEDALDMELVSPCFDRHTLAVDVAEWLDRDTVDARLRVQVTRRGDVLAFAISLGDQPGLVRAFDEMPGDCVAERRALALSIALAIDAVAPPVSRGDASVPVVFTASLAAGTPFPERPVLGAAVAGRLPITEYFLVGFGALAAEAPDQLLRDDVPARFAAWLTAARVDGCTREALAPSADVSVCAGTWLGAVTTRAAGVGDARTQSGFWWAATATLELQFRFTSAFGAHAAIDGFAALRRGKVQLVDSLGATAVAREMPALGAFVRIGPTVFF